MRKKSPAPENDPNAIGNLLVSGGHCSRSDINRALAYQKEHPGVWLGQHLAKRGVISQETLELVIARQDAARGRDGGAIRFAQLATKRVRVMARGIDRVVGRRVK